jgi:tetratricopeptide (TPR) repeat protein
MVKTKKVYAPVRPTRYRQPQLQRKGSVKAQGTATRDGPIEHGAGRDTNLRRAWKNAIRIEKENIVTIISRPLSDDDRRVLDRASVMATKGNTVLAENIISGLHRKYPVNFTIIAHLVDVIEKSRGIHNMLIFMDQVYKAFKNALPAVSSSKKSYMISFHELYNKPFLEFVEYLGTKHWEVGNVNRALDILLELLKFNPTDNMGIRESVLHVALKSGRMDIAEQIPSIIAGPGSMDSTDTRLSDLSAMIYGWGLYYFKRGDKKKSKDALVKAINKNPYIIQYLKGDLSIKDSDYSLFERDVVVSGGSSEAIKYYVKWHSVWDGEADAKRFLLDLAREINYQDIMKAKDKRFEKLEGVIDKLRLDPGTRFEDMGTTVEEIDDPEAGDMHLTIPGSHEIPNLISEGESLAMRGKSVESAEKYLNAWVLIKQLMHDHGGNLRSVVKVLSSLEVEMVSYCSDFMMELNNAGLEDDAYYRKAVDIGHEILEIPAIKDNRDASFTIKRDVAEAYFYQGDGKTGNEAFAHLVREYPNEIWAYIGWGDQLAGDETDPCHDYVQAELLYLKALELMLQNDQEDVADLTERFKTLFEHAGTPEKLKPLLRKMKKHEEK